MNKNLVIPWFAPKGTPLSSHSITQRALYAVVTALTLSLISGCDWHYDQRTELEKIRDRGVLRVGTLNNQLSYYVGSDGPTGLEYELASAFAQQLGVKLEMQPAYTISGLFPALERGDVDIVAAGLTITPERLAKFRPGPTYYRINQQLVYKNGHWRPRDVSEVNKDGARIAVVAESSHELTLKKISEQYPEIKWESLNHVYDDELLKQVADGTLDFTIADNIDIALVQRSHPNLTVALDLTEEDPVAWFTTQSHDDSLYALMIEFFGKKNRTGELATLEERYLGHIGTFDFVDTRAFLRALENTLPKWKSLFKKYADEFDWRLLAALSYQESHWNPLAVSPTGVRGMMMLTLPTAKSVGVKNRLDPEQSIRGGAEYLRKMLHRVPASVAPEEKIWFALTSYNIGFGHMMDARRITEQQGGNPNSWSDMKQNLPLLAERRYNKNTRYGFARGHEALQYVENIRRYYHSILARDELHERPEMIATDFNYSLEGLQTISLPSDAQDAIDANLDPQNDNDAQQPRLNTPS